MIQELLTIKELIFAKVLLKVSLGCERHFILENSYISIKLTETYVITWMTYVKFLKKCTYYASLRLNLFLFILFDAIIIVIFQIYFSDKNV